MENLENKEMNIQEENVESSDNTTEIAQIEYDILNTEQEQAYLYYQKKYVYKKNWLKTIGFGILAIGFAISSFRNPSQALNFILLTICIAAIVIIWYNTKKIRSSIVEALKIIEDDKYMFTLYDDRFVIKTTLTNEVEFEEENVLPVPPKVVNFSTNHLDIIEKNNMYIFIIKKDMIYVLPKRCMRDNQITTITEFFSNKLSSMFIREE